MTGSALTADHVRGLVGEGFPGERKLVVPRPVQRAALSTPGTCELLVTDCGYFPNAGRHLRARTRPIDQAVVLICVKGRGWCETPEGRFDVATGQVAVLPPDTPHAYGSDEGDPWTIWWLHVAGRSVPGLVSLVGSTPAAPVRVPVDVPGTALLAAEVVARVERDTTASSLLAASGAAWHLLTVLASSRSVRDASESVVEQAAEHLRRNTSVRTSVTELASTAGLSASHFGVLFRRRFGVSVLTYQTQLRMSRARELLATTQHSIAQVGAQCGYDDSWYFSRQFRKAHGMSPSAFRKQQDQ
ncbi:AraC family transcriptional regulator [Kineococcus sp. TBRC 1896]|uniref:AraC family transcriptional regulator n=1 Tax=Kineococcus mangrovi TaxID=1660183 RepID=A0ABV4I098_9ACTN